MVVRLYLLYDISFSWGQSTDIQQIGGVVFRGEKCVVWEILQLKVTLRESLHRDQIDSTDFFTVFHLGCSRTRSDRRHGHVDSGPQ